MKRVLVDSSIWIDFFRHGKNSSYMNYLIDNNILLINDIILTELVPYLKIKKQNKVINLLKTLNKVNLQIDWKKIIDMQYKCLTKGINKIGIPDLIITQNVIDNNLSLYTLDKHFEFIRDIYDFDIY